MNLLTSSNVVETINIEQLADLEEAGFKDASYAMRDLNKEHLQHLIDVPSISLPPIETVRIQDDNGKVWYVIIDGMHRVAASMKRKDKTIQGYVRTYASETEVIDKAFKANLNHGLATSTQTRSAYARWLKKTKPSMGVNEIAKVVGLDKSVVSRTLAKQAIKTTSSHGNSSRQGNDGRKCVNAIANAIDNMPFDANTSYEQDCNRYASLMLKYLDTLDEKKQEDIRQSLEQAYDVLEKVI